MTRDIIKLKDDINKYKMNTTKLFLESLEILLTTIDYNDTVERSVHVLEKNVRKLNKEFYENNYIYRSDFNGSVLPPVALVSSDAGDGMKYKFAFFSLSPGINAKYMGKELNKALKQRGDWRSYAEFYTKACDGLLNVILPEDRYYRNRIALMKGILEDEYLPWNALTNGLTNKEKKEDGIKFLKDNGVIVTDVFPFHSESHNGKFDLIKMYKANYLYSVYNRFILQETFKMLDKDGFFIVESGLAIKAFLYFLSRQQDLENIFKNANKILSNSKKYSESYFTVNDEDLINIENKEVKNPYVVTGYYKRKKVVLINDFIKGREGCFKRSPSPGERGGDCRIRRLVEIIKAM